MVYKAFPDKKKRWCNRDITSDEDEVVIDEDLENITYEEEEEEEEEEEKHSIIFQMKKKELY
uniref:Uncharacterized protein n=1 Tax=Romanomermis culicivorax TaxID=13658 RepID=A0A915LBT9_ROMCU